MSYRRAVLSIEGTEGVVREVTDAGILDTKARIDRAGIGCEPASAAAVAGVARLVSEGVIARTARVVCVLTGHLLKDPETTLRYHQGEFPGAKHANPPVSIEPTGDALARALDPGR